MTRVDVIVAVRDEEQAIPTFLDQLFALSLPEGVDMRVVFVEDSSTDGTRPLLRRLALNNPKIGYYFLKQGFGQSLANTFGLSRSTADAMIMMDVDGTHPLHIIPDMVRAFLDGAQVVQYVRQMLTKRKAYRDIGTVTYRVSARLLAGVDTSEQVSYYRLVSKEIARQVLQQPRYWHFLRFPLPQQPEGAVRRVYADSTERVLGTSKYNFRRLVSLAIDAVLSQMSSRRYLAFTGVSLLVVLLLARAALWLPMFAVAISLVWLTHRYRSLSRPLLLQKMEAEVEECSNVAT